MSTVSAIYEGTIRHRRFVSQQHGFGYRIFMMYLDLAELPDLFDGHPLWSARRPAPAWFRRADYLGDPAVPLHQAVRDVVQHSTGRRPTGPVCMLTHLRYWGYVLNPITLYYCFDAAGDRLEALVAEVTNTPWGERHAYVLAAPQGAGSSRGLRQELPKAMHVSPFMGMDLRYAFRAPLPGRRLLLHIENRMQGRTGFDATLYLRRRPLTRGSLTAVLWRYPWMTARVLAGIYGQAFRLWRKGLPVHDHPPVTTHLSQELP
jgi:hypothetical protein